MMTLMITVVRYESPKFSIVKHRSEDAIAVIHLIYKTEGSLEIANEIEEFISSTIQK